MIDKWYEPNRVYDGTGTPKKFSDDSIIICHELRQVYKLPLRQCEGFINSIFHLLKLPILYPDYSYLSKRLALLEIESPRYKQSNAGQEEVAAIAIDSSGLKQFGRDEWHQEKHKVAGQRSWRKLHIAVEDEHIIDACVVTEGFVSDDQAIDNLLQQIDVNAAQFTAEGAYDKNPVYNKIATNFPEADSIIPPDSDAIYSATSHPQRNRNRKQSRIKS